MESSILTQVILPLVLVVIMFGMGLSLTKDDFLRLWKMPKPVFVGLFGQLILLPIIAFFVAKAFELSAPLAVGLMILAACPGGTSSNVICHLCRANLALSVTLTAITTVVCVFSTPFIIAFSIDYFVTDKGPAFSLIEVTIGLFFITLFPVLVGIFLRHKYPNGAMRKEAFFRRFSAIFLVVTIFAVLIQERAVLAESFSQMFGAAITLNIVAILVGLMLARLARLNLRDGVTLSIEVGVQNSTMAILIAGTFLQKQEYAVSAGVYGLTMYLGAAFLVWYAKLITKAENKG